MRLIIMFVAIALAAGAFFLTVHFTSKPPEPPPQAVQQVVVEPTSPAVAQEETKDIYTAKQDLTIGTVITPEMLDLRPWPVSLLKDNEDIVVADATHPPSSLAKMIVRSPFQKGEPIYKSKLANENDPSFLASSLGEGMRLVTIAVDVVSGAGGFVFPGDHVDILATHDVITSYKQADTGGQSPGSNSSDPIPVKEPVTEVLIPDVRVLATNQKTTAHGGDAPIVPTNISVEVSAADAQKIRLTESGNGHLSILLRSLKDKDSSKIPPPTEVTDLSALRMSNQNPDALQVTVVRGVSEKTVGVTNP